MKFKLLKEIMMIYKNNLNYKKINFKQKRHKLLKIKKK